MDPRLVEAARKEEIEEIRRMNVYKKVPREQCVRETGLAPVGTRWVDVNKGDSATQNVRSRLVAQEVKKSNIPAG